MLKRLFLLIAIFIFSSTCGAQEPDLGPDIYVGVATKQISIQIKGQESYQVFDPQDDSILYTSAKQENSFLNVRNKNLYLNDLKLPNKIKVRAIKDSNIQINRRTYRGEFIISLDKQQQINVVNVLPLEEYLYSVLPQEMPASWPEQALKAQAVAARSFAYSALGRRDTQGYDVLADTSSQVYGGKEYENPTTTKIVQETYGEAVVFNDKVVETFFHSSSGGQTESSLAVWGTEIPYLNSVVDFDQKSPYYKWQVSFSPEEFDRHFADAGCKLGKIKALDLSYLSKEKDKSTADRSYSGRLIKLRILGETGWEVFKATQFRQILKLKSTLFDIAVGIPMPEIIEAPILDVFGNQVAQVDIEVNLDNKNSVGLPQDTINIRRLARSNNEKIIITGYGWGHGVGMSQWGAKGMVEEALTELLAKENAKLEAEKSAKIKIAEPKDKTNKKDKTNEKDKTNGKDKKNNQDVSQEKTNEKSTELDKVEEKEKTTVKIKTPELERDFYHKIIQYYFKGCYIKKLY